MVVKYLLSGPIRIAKSFVIDPLSTHSIQTFSKVCANLISASFLQLANTFKEIPPVSFNANMFSNILQANRECESVDMKVSSKGLIKLNFEVDDFESEYYVVATQNVV